MPVQRVALKCQLSRGGFSDERIFKIRLAKGEYIGVASRRYCWNENDEPLQEDEPTVGQTLQGKVAARVIEVRKSGDVLVSVPDSQVISVKPDQILERPPEVDAHVPIGP